MKRALAFTLPLLALLVASPVKAQVKYEDVVEKIHYTHPNAMVNGKPYDAIKQTGSDSPLFNVYIWGDLSETYTQKFFRDIFPYLKSRYSDDARFVYSHDPFLDQDATPSILSSVVAECAAEQFGFWDNIEPIIDNSQSLATLNKFDYLKDINIENLRNCLSDPSTRNVVDESKGYAKYLGFNGAPTIVIQNTAKPTEYSIKISGAQSTDIFDKAFLEAKSGDLTKKEAQDLSGRVGTLEQQTQQNQQDIQQTQEKVSALQQVVDNLARLVQSILEKLQALFGGSKQP